MNFQEYSDLVTKMISWARAYYKYGKPEISDPEWDTNYRALGDWEAANPTKVLASSPYGKVGAAMYGESGQIIHNPPMLSLKNAMDTGEALAMLDNKHFKQTKLLVFEYKADGVACRLSFKNGKYESAATRGDGMTGDDITRHVSPKFADFPEKVDYKDDLLVDGELIITYDDFEKLNAKRVVNGLEPYKNTRNAVAGMLRSERLEDYEKKAITFIAYELHAAGKHLMWSLNRTWLAENDFKVIPELRGKDFEKMVNSLAKKRDTLPFMIDGVVVKMDDYKVRDRLGSTNHSPRWAFSYKFPSITGKTVLESVGFTVGRTGQVTGMAYFNPVDIGGVTVSKSAIDSIERWKDLSLSKGAVLTVSRRADVRPYVESCETTGGTIYPFISACPWCNTKLSLIGKKVFCTNNACTGRVIAQIAYAVDKTALDIEDISEQTVTLLCQRNVIKRVSDLYNMKKEHLVDIGFTKYSAEKMVANIEASKDTTLDRIIVSLGIPSVARTASKNIASYMRDIGKYSVKHLVAILLDNEEVDKLPIGDANKENIKTFIAEPMFAAILETYPKIGFRLRVDGQALEGMNYVITGTLEAIKRSDLESRLLKAGATVQSGVSKETNVLITDDKTSPPWDKMPSAKLQKADKLGIPIMTSKQFLAFLDSKGV